MIINLVEGISRHHSIQAMIKSPPSKRSHPLKGSSLSTVPKGLLRLRVTHSQQAPVNILKEVAVLLACNCLASQVPLEIWATASVSLQFKREKKKKNQHHMVNAKVYHS